MDESFYSISRGCSFINFYRNYHGKTVATPIPGIFSLQYGIPGINLVHQLHLGVGDPTAFSLKRANLRRGDTMGLGKHGTVTRFYIVNRFLPVNRRRFKTRLPVADAIRLRNPCFRARFFFFG